MITDVYVFQQTLQRTLNAIRYEDLPRDTQFRLNALMGFVAVRRKGYSMARLITEAGDVNGFEAAVGDYHVRPVNLDNTFTDDLGWIVQRGVFRNTYEWLSGFHTGEQHFQLCRKSVPNWVYDTNLFAPWDYGVVVSSPEADKVLTRGDYLALGSNGEQWVIPALDRENFEPLNEMAIL